MAYSPVPCHLRTFKPRRCNTKRRFRLFCLCSYHRLCKCLSCILQESPNVWPRHQRSDLITLESTLPNSQWTNGRHDLKILFNGAWRRVSSLSLYLIQVFIPSSRYVSESLKALLSTDFNVSRRFQTSPRSFWYHPRHVHRTKRALAFTSRKGRMYSLPQILIYLPFVDWTRYIVYEINGRIWFSWFVSPASLASHSSSQQPFKELKHRFPVSVTLTHYLKYINWWNAKVRSRVGYLSISK